jgi:hypothetical protein
MSTNISDFENQCQASESKIIRFIRKPNQDYIHRHPVPLRGALAIVATRDGERWTRKLRLTSVADAYGKDVWS